METYTITLTITGTLKNPNLTLQDKSGTLNELEILSILTFGQPLGGISGDARDRLRSFISQSILGIGTRKLEQFLGIERINVQGDPFNNSEGKGARLTIAKRVTPRLMVLYETDIADIDNLNSQKISALYRITNNLFLSGERNEKGDAGVDLLFKFSK